MVRILTLATAGSIALAAFLYGVVLNGFGLFGPDYPPGNTTVISPGASPKAVTTRPVDPAETAMTPLAPKTDRAARRGSQETPAAPPEPEPTRVARDVTPPNVLARPTSHYKDPKPEERAEEEKQDPTRRYHRVVVRDARTLESGDVTIRFAGIAPIAADKICTDETGDDWPCGRVAAGALRMLIRHRAIDCAVVSQTEGEITGTCSAGLQDINGWLVAQGWAEVSSGADYTREADAARAEKRGVYLAEWKPESRDASGAVSLTAFTAPGLPPDTGSGAASVAFPQGSVEGAADQGTGLVDAVQGNE